MPGQLSKSIPELPERWTTTKGSVMWLATLEPPEPPELPSFLDHFVPLNLSPLYHSLTALLQILYFIPIGLIPPGFNIHLSFHTSRDSNIGRTSLNNQ